MAEERLRILQMLAEGKINPEEAEKLLTALEPADPPIPPPPPGARGPRHFGPFPLAQRLHIHVRSEDGDEVDLAWPLGGLKSVGGVLPSRARDVVADKCGVDLAALGEADTGGCPSLASCSPSGRDRGLHRRTAAGDAPARQCERRGAARMSGAARSRW